LNLGTRPIPRCGSFHSPFSKTVLSPLFRVLLFCPLLLIVTVSSIAQYPLHRISLCWRNVQLLSHIIYLRVSKRTSIYLLSFHIFLIGRISSTVETLILEIFSLCLSRFPASEYNFPFSFILAQYQLVTVPFSSRTFRVQITCSIFRCQWLYVLPLDRRGRNVLTTVSRFGKPSRTFEPESPNAHEVGLDLRSDFLLHSSYNLHATTTHARPRNCSRCGPLPSICLLPCPQMKKKNTQNPTGDERALIWARSR
jgi:hypothetical protein